MTVDLFFGVPLIVQDVDPATRESIRNKVSAFLKSERARETVTPAPEESVSTSFYLRNASILADARLEELEKLILKTARSYLEQTLKLPPRQVEIEHAWINIFESGSQEGQHTHDGSLLSCSYYVEAPEDCGCIVFPDPIGARRSYREFTETSGQELLNRREIAVEPKPGRLVMFESWVPHYIQCNKSDKVRISIAINLRGAPAVDKSSQTFYKQNPITDVKAGNSQSAQAPVESDAAVKDGKPFLFNDLFEVNPGARATLNPLQDSIPTIVIDDFLSSPDQARGVVGRTPATNWKHEPGGKNFTDYYDCRLRFPIRYPNHLIAAAQKAIQKVFGLNTRPADPSVDVNWFMQINDKRGDFAVPHADMTENVTRSFTCILYLNRREECSGGTAFFRFKPSDSLVIDEGYAQAVKQDARISETGLDYWPENTEDLWESVGVIDMLPGRLLIFPSQYFHSAYHPQNSFYDFPRLTLAFWMIS
jgi:uncharacterized protein (TIGR02466 family)